MERIIFFIGTLGEGGAQRVISILAKAMTDSGRSVKILLYKEQQLFYSVDDRVEIDYVIRETQTSNIVKNLLYIRRYFHLNADRIFSFLAPFNILAIIAHIGLKNTLVVADRNDPRKVPANVVLRKIRDFLYRFANGVVLQTRSNQAYFSKTVQKKSIVICNPVDLGEKQGLALRSKKGKTIVSIGRLMPQKNQQLLIRAFADMHREYPEYQLVIYGEGPERENLEKLAEELGVSEWVSMPGNKKNIFDYIASAEMFVLSSNYEGMPNALIEAMCLGLPVVSTKVSGAIDLIRHDENGLLAECGSQEQLKQMMIKIASDAQLRKSYGENAVQINEQLSLDSVSRQWCGFKDTTKGI